MTHAIQIILFMLVFIPY